jgi:hypothetical protein
MLRAPPPSTPTLLTNGLDRRTLLKAAGIGGLLLAGGGALFRTLRGFGPPAKGLFVLDDLEADVVTQLAGACFPGPPDWPLSADEVNVTAFVDLYVSQLYTDTQGLFRTLVRAVNVSTLPTHGATMRALPADARLAAWKAWGDSSLHLRRAGYQSLTFAMNLGYFEDDRVRAAAGFTRGCDLSVTPNRPDLWTMVRGEGTV